MNIIKSLINWVTGKPPKKTPTEHQQKQANIDNLFKTKRL